MVDGAVGSDGINVRLGWAVGYTSDKGSVRVGGRDGGREGGRRTYRKWPWVTRADAENVQVARVELGLQTPMWGSVPICAVRGVILSPITGAAVRSATW